MALDSMDIYRLLNKLHPQWDVQRVTPAGSGLSSTVFRCETTKSGDLAIKVARAAWLESPNSFGQHAESLLRQESALASHCYRYNIPAPQPIELHLEPEFTMLISEWIESDSSVVESEQLGEMIARIHQIPPPDLLPIEHRGHPPETVLAQRLGQRLSAFRQATDLVNSDQAAITGLLGHIGEHDYQPSLLHMDYRPANLLSRRGKLVGVIDWANAMIADPALELARIREFDLVDDKFIAGYERVQPLPRAPAVTELLYRIDSALMLALVFLLEAPDPPRAKLYVKRVTKLLAQLRGIA